MAQPTIISRKWAVGNKKEPLLVFTLSDGSVWEYDEFTKKSKRLEPTDEELLASINRNGSESKE